MELPLGLVQYEVRAEPWLLDPCRPTIPSLHLFFLLNYDELRTYLVWLKSQPTLLSTKAYSFTQYLQGRFVIVGSASSHVIASRLATALPLLITATLDFVFRTLGFVFRTTPRQPDEMPKLGVNDKIKLNSGYEIPQLGFGVRNTRVNRRSRASHTALSPFLSTLHCD